jgi:phosphoribosylformylglycinamidine synthase
MSREFNRQKLNLPSFEPATINVAEALDRLLALPTIASKSFLITIGDRSITGQVHRDQMVGPWQVPVADCAVTTVSYDSYAGEAMAMGERTPLALINGPASGRMAVAEAITNISATRIEKLSDIKLSANWMCAAGYGGEDEVLFDTVKAVGMEFCPALGITIPVGKDSMSMRTTWRDADADKSITAPMSLIITAFSPVNDVRKTVTPQLRTDLGDTALLLVDLGAGKQRLGASCLAQVYQQIGDTAPDIDDPKLLSGFFNAIQQLLEEEKIIAYHDRSDGGTAITLLEMAFAGHCGLDIDLGSVGTVHGALFAEEAGAVVQVKVSDLNEVMAIFAEHGLSDLVQNIGNAVAGNDVQIRFSGSEVIRGQRLELHRKWQELSYRMQALRDNSECAQQEFDSLVDADPGLSSKLSFDAQQDIAAPFIKTGVRPRVAILREQGVNGQMEMAAAFDRAGFSAVDVHMSDILSGRVSLADFKGLAACGGFSYGDVLGAGEGWAKTILFNARARDDTFALGVCNGCQMMSNLHSLIPGAEFWPRFVRNRSEQFEARVAQLEIPESPSILLAGMAGSHLPVAIAHGEGRAEFADATQLGNLQQSGKVALQFIDNHLAVTEQYPANPNGSPAGIAGASSADGRVTIMMPHPERVFRTVQNSWIADNSVEDSGWMRLFRNARVWVG